jgi:Zn-dependent protease
MESLLDNLLGWVPLLALGAADLRRVGIFVICLVLAICVHEFSHAFFAHKLGDRTPERQGRLTLNPIAHADPIGTLALPVILALMSPGFLFGWGRPVETQPRLYTRRISMRGGMALVAFAGPLANLALAALTVGIVWLLGLVDLLPPMVLDPLLVFFNLNIILMVFNLLPIHPLDGGKILAWFLGPKRQHIDDFLMRYGGFIIIILVVALPGVLRVIVSPFYEFGGWVLRAVL